MLNTRRVVLVVALAVAAVGVASAQGPRGRNDQGYEIQVSAQQQWTSTGITVRQGETMRFEASGEVTLNREGSLRARPNGAAGNQFDRDAWLPNVPVGTLIGRIGAGEFRGQRAGRPFVIGDRASVTMPDDGELFLGINDSNFTDNRGAFAVSIDVPREGRGRGRGRGNDSDRDRYNDQGRQFQVSAQQQWSPTGIMVRQGDTIRFEATGEVTLNQDGSLRARPDGAAGNQLDRDARLPDVRVGTLIGRVGGGGFGGQRGGQPFVIGGRASVTMRADGELFLGINDSNFADNRGAFSVRVDAPGEGSGPSYSLQGSEFQVPARQQWVPTGITVRQGDVLRFRATGEIMLNNDRSLRARPGGAANNQFDREASLPNAPVGALLGRIDAPGRFGRGNSRAFVIGDQQNVTMPLDGELLLGVNDSNFADNNGAFTVRIDSR